MRYESRNKKLNRQPGTVKNWIYHRGDIYLANLNPFKGSEQNPARAGPIQRHWQLLQFFDHDSTNHLPIEENTAADSRHA